MAGRKKGSVLNDKWRERIQAGVIMDRMLKAYNGEVNLTTTQVKAGQILLSKIVPDLGKLMVEGNPDKPLVTKLDESSAALLARYVEKQKRLKDADK